MAILYGFANISYSLIQLDNSKHRSRAISRLSKGRKMHVLSCNIDYPSVPRSPESMFAFTTQHVVIEVPERTSDWSELKTFKTFSHKKRISIPMMRGRDRKTDLAWPWCAVLWCGRDLWAQTAHSHLPCFALCRKTTPNKHRAAKPYKMAMNWA